MEVLRAAVGGEALGPVPFEALSAGEEYGGIERRGIHHRGHGDHGVALLESREWRWGSLSRGYRELESGLFEKIVALHFVLSLGAR